MGSTPATVRLRALLRIQSGLITRVQALDAGMSPSAITRRLATDQWSAVLPGVYLIDSARLNPDSQLLAARLWLGPAAVVDGHWAAWLHHLVDHPKRLVSLTVARPLAPRPRPRGFVRVPRRTLDLQDVTKRSGIRVTTRALTALECAGLDDGPQIMDRALQLGTTATSLHRAHHRLRGARGAIAADRALWRVQGGEVSVAEREYRRLLRCGGIQELRPSVKVTASGREMTLDFASKRLRLAVEIDGWRVHSTGEAFHRDRAKQNLLEVEMWTTLRYTPRQIHSDGQAVLAQTRHVIQVLEQRLADGSSAA